MAHSTGSLSYPPSGNPQPGLPGLQISRVRVLLGAVAILGLATIGLGFGHVSNGEGTIDWYIRFAALAALVAAFGLLPRQKPLPRVVAVLATMGFIEAVVAVFTSNTGWTLTVITVLNTLQASAAVAALLLAPNDDDARTTGGYQAYVDYYNEAVRDYYRQHAQPTSPPEQSQRSSHGRVSANAQESASPRQRPSQHGDYGDLDYSAARPSAPVKREAAGSPTESPPGLPSSGQAEGPVDHPHRRDEQSSWPP